MSESDAASPDLIVTLLLQLHEEAKSSYSASLQYEMVNILLRKRVTMPNHISTWVKKQGIPKIPRETPKPAARKEKQTIQHAFELYEMMAKLMPFCEPDGPGIGPSCRVRLLDFERMSVKDLFSTTTHMRFLWKLEAGITRAMDLLDPQERKLYMQAREYGFANKHKPKPTLQRLAADILWRVNRQGIFERSPRRFVKALDGYDFPDSDNAHAWAPGTDGHRRRTIAMVNRFGKDREPFGPRLAAETAKVAGVMSEQVRLAVESIKMVPAFLQGMPAIASTKLQLSNALAAIAVDPAIVKAQQAALLAIGAATSEALKVFFSYGSEEPHDPTV